MGTKRPSDKNDINQAREPAVGKKITMSLRVGCSKYLTGSQGDGPAASFEAERGGPTVTRAPAPGNEPKFTVC